MMKKNETKSTSENVKIRKEIEKRKIEYQKREEENRELVVSTIGSVVGVSQNRITVKQQGKIVYNNPIGALSHITIRGKGISVSSDLIEYCLSNKISIDFFSFNGGHIGSILSTKYIENTLWIAQANCGRDKRNFLAKTIIKAKLKNQINLVKYFHKYHKTKNSWLISYFDKLDEFFQSFKYFEKNCGLDDDDYVVKLVSYEAQGASKYWSYVKELLSDDNTQFEKRENKGAVDIVNSMLNYGYAILYSRVWQALLKAKLNPYDSIIHVRQSGKPTFVYDVVEIFRAQVVDRVVISLVQKKSSLAMEDGFLDDYTKNLLAKNVLDRINRYENYRGERITMEDIIYRQAKEIAKYVSEDNYCFKPYISKW